MKKSKGIDIGYGTIIEVLFVIVLFGVLVFYVIARVYDVRGVLETNSKQRAGIQLAELMISSPQGLALNDSKTVYRGVIDKKKFPPDPTRDCEEIFKLYFEEHTFNVVATEFVGTTAVTHNICGETTLSDIEMTRFPTTIFNGTAYNPGMIHVRSPPNA
jgi:type II secretory pathway pseudopilin PulG